MDPIISVIIPVLNEGRSINRTIAHLVHHNPLVPFEILVADGHPRKNTLSAIAFASVRKIPAPLGRGAQMNAGAALSKGKILLFLHADTLLEKAALKTIMGTLDGGNVAAGAFQLAIRSPRPVFRLIEFGVRLRVRWTRIPYGDQAIFISRRLFQALGRYPPVPIMEDVALMRAVREKGGRIVILKEKAFTSPRRWEKEGILFCTLRNWMLMGLFSIGVRPETLARLYPVHQ